jgi:hypothetical protein
MDYFWDGANMSGILQGIIASIGGAIGDAYFNLVTLLLPGNGTNGAQNNTFIDSSTNALSLTRIASTTQGTFSPFSQTGWSNYFDGTGDYLNIARNSAFDVGSGNFTIECWVFAGAFVTATPVFGQQQSSATARNSWSLRIDSSGYPQFQASAGSSNDVLITSSTAISLNTWNHVAGVRNGTTWTLYVNGVSTGTATASITVNYDGTYGDILLGASRDVATYDKYYTGYISNARLVKGTAVYTAAFTPSTAPLTAITNTQLLTCQSNRFVDNSTNAFAITVNGNTSVQAFSPFLPTDDYDPAVVGGSGYFPDSDGGVTVPSNAVLNLGTGDFTLECWMYRPTSGTKYIFLANNFTNGLWAYTSGDKIVVGIGNADRITSTGVFQNNAWNHIAIARSGTTTTLYINGVSNGSYSASVTINQGALTVGNYSGNYSLFGYLANFRLVKGTAVYTGAFTPPTALLSTSGSASASAYPSTSNVNTSFAASETSVLLNFVNAGITDATAKNDLETVGNAQISTAQSKFGGSSMLFDGTGDYISSPGSPLWLNGSGDWTIEGWIYLSSTPATNGFYIYGQDSGAAAIRTMSIVYNNSTAGSWKIWATSSGSSWDIANDVTFGSFTLATSTWYHFAVVRNGTNLKLYIDGTAQGSGSTISGSIQTNTSFNFNAFGQFQNLSGSGGFPGYIDDYRITKGYARYTANFTPPTSALPQQ